MEKMDCDNDSQILKLNNVFPQRTATVEIVLTRQLQINCAAETGVNNIFE